MTCTLAMLGWTATDVPMFIALPILLVASGFFSGSETALFGLSHAQRMELRDVSLSGRIVDALLRDQRMLLVTLLLGNTTINVAYFVVTSVLVMHSDANAAIKVGIASAFLIGIVIGGEVVPKSLAASRRVRFAALCAPPLLTLHTVIAPIRVVLTRVIITPLCRLVAPRPVSSGLRDEELASLLDVSGDAGVIDDEERRLLGEMIALRRLRVRDVMTPRVRMHALPANADRSEVLALAQTTRSLTIPIYDGTADTIEGILHVKDYLASQDAPSVTDPRVLRPARYVPELATLDQLLEQLRTWRTRTAVVIDEYGGTEGVVTIEDVVAEVVGDITIGPGSAIESIRLVGIGTWEIDGELPLHDFEEAFGVSLDAPQVSTIGGYVVDRLGRAARQGDHVDAGEFHLRVRRIEGKRIAILRLSTAPEPRE